MSLRHTARAARSMVLAAVLASACSDALVAGDAAQGDAGSDAEVDADAARGVDAGALADAQSADDMAALDRACMALADGWGAFMSSDLGTYRACTADSDCTRVDDTVRCGDSRISGCGVVVAKAQQRSFASALDALTASVCGAFRGVSGGCISSPSCLARVVSCSAGLCSATAPDAGAADAATATPDASGEICPPECFRAYRCAARCDAVPFENGCCPCPAGTIDILGC